MSFIQYFKDIVSNATVTFNQLRPSVTSAAAGIPDRVNMSARAEGHINRKRSPLVTRIQELYARYGYKWDSHINIFGIRDESNARADVYNDYICVVLSDERDLNVAPESVYVFACTTDPGVYWSDNDNRARVGWSAGAAHLCLGQYLGAYVVGPHRGEESLVQWGNKVRIWRDLDENFQNNENVVQEGYFGINIHRGAGNKIGKWSAGCQVIPGTVQFNAFMQAVKSSMAYRDNPKFRYNYTLFDKGQVGTPLLNALKGLV